MTGKISFCRSRNILVFSRRLRFPIAVFVSITFPSESEGPTNHAPRYLQYLEAMDTYIFKCYASCQQWHPFLCTFSDSFDSTFDSTLPSCNIMTLKLDITYHIGFGFGYDCCLWPTSPLNAVQWPPFHGMITPLFSRVVLMSSLLKLKSLCSCVIFTNSQRVIQIWPTSRKFPCRMSLHGYTVLDGTS